MNRLHYISLLLAVFVFACQAPQEEQQVEQTETAEENELTAVTGMIRFDEFSADTFNLEVPVSGRYRITAYKAGGSNSTVWLEDYIHNTDGRTYNITGNIAIGEDGSGSIDGAPLAAKKHQMRYHSSDSLALDSLKFELLVEHQETPTALVQNMEGEEWSLVWWDDFDGEGLPDSTKWSYNIGNWGWGNNELQYYTEGRLENARQENGHLIIEALKNDMGQAWTSARLTTAGKTSFTYGRIEYRAKVPVGRGTWAAGWTLGDAYVDEISWPYCGEIDVLECVGYEIDDESGSGINHATCHTRAYYFKQGNQIGDEIEIDSMDTKFHTYAVEWYPDVIKGYLDGEHYFTYDKNADELEWPFHAPQNIVINLAIGGGWGGAQGMDESYDKHAYIIDYIRVYEKI